MIEPERQRRGFEHVRAAVGNGAEQPHRPAYERERAGAGRSESSGGLPPTAARCWSTDASAYANPAAMARTIAIEVSDMRRRAQVEASAALRPMPCSPTGPTRRWRAASSSASLGSAPSVECHERGYDSQSESWSSTVPPAT